ncbi:hypothetical protein KIW84_045881 [Lathyrus oleraceus]|uniref:Retrovirus-related Pol polyprotein from transposon TNT 1-94-like beta-barrel domain-containing protein n=1 Tax=Pisum sativum TaxID=3888 RepID=A0A9D4XP99_PEA|nr:hypothetical protein KIW84_045881 [Pisum sativum]
MTGCKDWFFELEEGLNRSVKLGNDTRMSVVGKGSVKVQVNGATQVIPEVYYVPELKNNLLSLGQLHERGLAILIRDGTCKVYHPKKGAIMETNMSGNRMFFLLTSKLQKHDVLEDRRGDREGDEFVASPKKERGSELREGFHGGDWWRARGFALKVPKRSERFGVFGVDGGGRGLKVLDVAISKGEKGE